MDIWMIWATDGDVRWLVAAWDDDSVSDNNDGWLSEVEQARRDHGENFRIVRASIDFDAVDAAFAPPSVGAMTNVRRA